MKKKAIILDVLAALSFIGAYAAKHFADRRIGFVRWLNFNGNKLREALPLDAVKYALLAIAAMLVIAALIRLIRRKDELMKNDVIMAVVMIAALLFCAYATYRYTYAFSPSSFMLVPLIDLGTLLVAVRNLLSPARAGKADEK